MLHDNMDINCLMVHAQKVDETRIKRNDMDLRGPSLVMEVLPRVDLIFKTSVGSRRGFPNKFIKISLRLTRIGCLTLCPEKEKVEAHLVKNLLVPSVVRMM